MLLLVLLFAATLGHRVEVRSHQALDELLRGQLHTAAALQCAAVGQVADTSVSQVQQGHRSTALQGEQAEETAEGQFKYILYTLPS